MRSWMSSWRLALRLARRDLLKHRARAVIALVMVTLPVLAVVAADVLIQTAEVSASEGIGRRLGAVATAEVRIVEGQMQVQQGADPAGEWGGGEPLTRPTTVADIEGVIGHRSTLRAPDAAEVLVRTPHGREPVDAAQVDAAAPLARGLYRLVDGRWPAGPEEVVVNEALHDRGVGRTLTVVAPDRTESVRTVVGTIVDPTLRSRPVVLGLPGSLPSAISDGLGTGWLVDGPPISWAQVKELNALGVLVTDRHIAGHPGDYPALYRDTSVDGTAVQVTALIVVMALIEVVLLAGPAFAVGARKQQRSLALLVSSGGTPAQSRRVILAGGLLLGLSAAVVGVVGGIGAGWLLRPLVQRFDDTWLGPFDVPWPHLAAVASFGLVSALVACLVPAWIASRQNVVAVLAGRRGDARPVRAFPVLGVVLFAVGVLMAIAGARDSGDFMVAWSAVVCVLGMVLLVPVVVSWIARIAGRFPLPVRFAARDAVRHRTRTTPAVAAVAATVAGVVALGISTSSDAKENRATYQPTLRMGDAAVTPEFDYYAASSVQQPTDWDGVTEVVRQHVPDADVTPVVGLGQPLASSWVDVSFTPPGGSVDADQITPATSGSALGDLVVSDGAPLPSFVAASVPGAEVRRALADGRAVVFTDDTDEVRLDHVDLHASTGDEQGNQSSDRTTTVPAMVLYADPNGVVPVRALLPPALVARAGLPSTVVGLELGQPHLTEAAEKDLAAALEALPTPTNVQVERGYVAPTAEAVLQWVLAALGAVLMLGGTLTAMFLALSDARPDLATLAAVGAAPSTRRRVAAAYTFVVAFVGAVLGMLVGFVPGIAITWPLTAGSYPGHHGPYLDVPWLMITVVVLGLPLLTAAVVALCTRSRLPMVARLG